MTQNELEKTLEDRNRTHGDFADNAALFAALSREMSSDKYSTTQQFALMHILGKLVRIRSGNSNVVDHWKDIAGYAMLAAKSIIDE